MALITCPECKKKVSESAASCPHCEFVLTAEKIALSKSKPRQDAEAFLLPAGIAVFLVVLTWSVLQPSLPTVGGVWNRLLATDSVRLNASVSHTKTQTVVMNSDTFDWTDVTLEINPTVFSSGFMYHVDKIGAGQSFTIGVMQFARSDGARFNPFLYKVQKVYISATVPEGSGSYSGEIK